MRQRTESVYHLSGSKVRQEGFEDRAWRASVSEDEAALLLLSAPDCESLRLTIQRLLRLAPELSWAELKEMAALSAARLVQGAARAALVVDSTQTLAESLTRLDRWLVEGHVNHQRHGVFLGSAREQVRIGLLFPGQGARAVLSGGMYRSRFDCVNELYERGHLPATGHSADTVTAQPAIVTASVGGLRLLKAMEIQAELAVGHSLGELTAFHWAGAWDEAAILRLATARGRVMGDLGVSTGAMAGIGVDAERVKSILLGDKVVIAGYNSPRQTVVSGEADEVRAVVIRAQRKGWPAIGLPVSHAFHSSLVAAAAPNLSRQLQAEPTDPLERAVFSTITGGPLDHRTDLRELLVRQVTAPVLFSKAVQAAEARGVDLWIEVGPGRILTDLMADLVQTPVVSMDASGDSIDGLLAVAAAAFVRGVKVRTDFLFNVQRGQVLH